MNKFVVFLELALVAINLAKGEIETISRHVVDMVAQWWGIE